MKWVIYEIPTWRRVGVYSNRVAALNFVHCLHLNVSERRYTVKPEAT